MTRLTIVFFLLLLFAGVASAQNYNPFPGHAHLFGFNQLGDSLQHAIHIDSTYVLGNDSVAVFNRVFHKGTFGPEWYVEKDNGFGKEMHRRPGGHIDFITSTGDTFRLETAVPVGTQWKYGPTDTIFLQSRTFGPVLGNPDSILIFQVLNGPQVRLSQHFGLVEAAPVVVMDSLLGINTVIYSLVGNEELAIGDSLPDFEDIFDFPVGASFQTKTYFTTNSQGFAETWRDFNVSSAAYQSSPRQFNYSGTTEAARVTTAPMLIDTVYFAPQNSSRDYFADAPYVESLPGSVDSTHIWDYFKVDPGSGRRTVRGYDKFQLIFDSTARKFFLFEAFIEVNYTEDIGRVLRSHTDFGYTDIETLECWNIVTDSGGTCKNLSSFMVGIEGGLIDAATVDLWPNPVVETLRLRSEFPVVTELYDLQGKSTGRKLALLGMGEMSLAGLPNGMYVLRMEDERGRKLMRKVLKQE